MMIRFGIPSLDLLLGQQGGASPDGYGFKIPEDGATTSLCFVGRHGTGKSVLALHLAARYLADATVSHGKTKVLYVSTDLTAAKAGQVWSNFALGLPSERQTPFDLPPARSIPTLEFAPILFQGKDVAATLAGRLRSSVGTPKLFFVDLAQSSAGDDWAFLNRLMANLEDTMPRHLVVIDAIEGFETLVGEHDSYGERLSRRSRIAQVMRLAANRCHVVFVSEEAQENVRLAEEFVVDAVVRLHNVQANGYDRRAIEFEKVRGQTHARGKHAFTIRRGNGSTTGKNPHNDSHFQKYLVNYDDPKLASGPAEQSYIFPFASLHFQSRQVMEDRDPLARPPAKGKEYASFGVKYLDEMLVVADAGKGIPFGQVGALIGDAGTRKTGLGHSFLAEAFTGVVTRLRAVIAAPRIRYPGVTRGQPSSLAMRVTRYFRARSEEWVAGALKYVLDGVGATVLITTIQDVSALTLAVEFAKWLAPEWLEQNPNHQLLVDILVSRIVCRRLELHDLSTAVLVHVVKQAVLGAEKLIDGTEPMDDERPGGLVRLVLQDFSTWKEIYPDIRTEQLFLPFLLFYLRRQQIATLIIDSHPGQPNLVVEDPFDAELRALVDIQIYTWRVQFFGEDRVAITTTIPLHRTLTGRTVGIPISVGELQYDTPDSRPRVDPHFEMYSGLEAGSPQPIGLQIRLYLTETQGYRDYVDDLNRFLGEHFPSVGDAKTVVRVTLQDDYLALRNLTAFQKSTRLDYTLAFAVDEFWCVSKPGGFRPEKPYIDTIVWPAGAKEGDLVEDPAGMFTPDLEDGRAHSRVEVFKALGYELAEDGKANDLVDRIPFTWDFGLMLCDQRAWEAACKMPIPGLSISVGEVWNALPQASGQRDMDSPTLVGENQGGKRPTWREFLGACKVVADDKTKPFDLSASSPEGLSCLILELWASERYGNLVDADSRKNFCERLSRRRWRLSDNDVKYIPLSLTKNAMELYKSWLLLIDTLDWQHVVSPQRPFDPVTGCEDASAIAIRHWFKSACDTQSLGRAKGLIPVGLPGNFSVRGDWFLAVSSASRSYRLADRCLDVLTSGRGNFARMQMGLGLPTRDIMAGCEGELRTGLVAPLKSAMGATDRSRIGNVAFGDLCRLGEQTDKDFHWLWRSSIRHYDLRATIWQKWLVRVALAWLETKGEFDRNWVGGLALYDKISRHFPDSESLDRAQKTDNWRVPTWEQEDPKGYEQFILTWNSFRQLRDLLKKLFLRASRPNPPR